MGVAFKGRREDFRLVTGQGKYTSDWSFPDEAYGFFLRADRAHARIVSLDASAARAHKGVLCVLTGEDVRGAAPVPPLVKYPGKGGMTLRQTGRDILAVERVRYGGEPVAFVVAATLADAMDAAELIEVEYDDLPIVLDAEKALEPGAPLLYDYIENNLAFDFEYGDRAKTEDAFARAAHVTKLTLDAARIAGNPMEPKACVAKFDAAKEMFDVYVPTQGITLMRPGLAVAAGVPEEKIRVYALDVGGGFGVRGEAYPEFVACMIAAKMTGRPVKWVSTRSETILSDHHGRGAKMTGELALDAEGKFIGLRIQWIVDCGAHLSGPGPFINTMAPSVHAANVYQIPALVGLHRLVLTNRTPTTAYRGAARPNVSYLMERLVEEAARETGRDRIELRRKNLIPKKAFPYKTPTGSVYDSGDPAGLLADVLKEADWKGVEKRRKAAQKRGKLYGAACSVFIEPSGGGAAPREEVAIRFGENGNPVLYTVSGPSGQGHETVFPEIVGRIFGVDPEKITLRASDPDGPALIGLGTIGSRSMMTHGGALSNAANTVIRKGRELASKHFEAAEADIEFADGSYRVRGTDLSVGLLDLAKKYAAGGENPLDTVDSHPMTSNFPTGAHVAEVEIDPETGVIDIVKYVAVDDAGVVLNHTLAEGQVHGGIMQGLGQVMGEICVYDDTSGQMITGSFMDYFMPRADLLPPLAIFDRPIPSPNNPLGVKGVGEAGTTGAVPTVTNAIIDALRPLGVNDIALPATPANVWGMIKAAGR
ncbi:MAG: xanthine dehydrogenase family protein molybdopterin-binding subunit [Beijerinckiaceae bacterium]